MGSTAGLAGSEGGTAPAESESNQDNDGLSSVAFTCRITAAFRAVEAVRGQPPVLHDPLAATLAGDAALRIVEADATALAAAQGTGRSLRVPARNALVDDELLRALAGLAGGARTGWSVRTGSAPDSHVGASSIVQVVNVGAGMDTKPWRMALPCHVKWFDVDQPAVLTLKERLLRSAGAALSSAVEAQQTPGEDDVAFPLLPASWVAVSADLATRRLAEVLKEAGHDPAVPTVWLAEALLYYLPLPQASQLLVDMRQMSAAGSTLIGTCADASLVRGQRGLQPDSDHYFSPSRITWHFDMDALAPELAAAGWELNAPPATTAELARSRYGVDTYVALYGGAELLFVAELARP